MGGPSVKRGTAYWTGPTDSPVVITDPCLNVVSRLSVLTLGKLLPLTRPLILLPHHIDYEFASVLSIFDLSALLSSKVHLL